MAENCTVTVEAEGDRYEIAPGGMIALPRGTAHSLWRGDAAIRRHQSLQPPFSQEERTGRRQGGGQIFCCRVPTSANPLPDIVPSVLSFDREQLRAENRLDLYFELIRHNALGPVENRGRILQKLAEIVATILLEHMLRDLKNRGSDLTGAANDANIRRALNAIHGSPKTNWTLAGLADSAVLGRSTFAQRFREATGKSPLQYLAEYRIALASQMLRESEISIAEIAYKVGYETDSAFSKAFKRLVGLSPTTYRARELNR
ncbi:AraC family transcriptional regulator [Parasphingopyxis algicola]|uniref:AraC family transcriptional regulator n=1 Tax=Parasphingopyxis algicola TaxID=2026624 RepID=UPI0015A3C793|nr:AraC family transcriptional regulator [Parasphingopyxis algicola]QLC26421.1 AraC family transcriptional regulator [Parasphingopyxis algicola]